MKPGDESLELFQDLVAYASLLGPLDLRKEVLKESLRWLTPALDGAGGSEKILAPILFSLESALKYDRWSYNAVADAEEPLPATQYLLIRKGIVEEEMSRQPNPSSFPVRIDRVQTAIREVWSKYGIGTVVPYIKLCWSNGMILSEDDFYWVFTVAIRAEAFSGNWKQLFREIIEADRSAGKEGAVTILSRARKLAETDRELARSSAMLEPIARRELSELEDKLSSLRGRSYPCFIRGLHELKPVYYCLRDIFYELHFLADTEEERQEWDFQETFVDERQADIGQMLHQAFPSVALGDLAEWGYCSVEERKRRLRFWRISRVQFNEEHAAFLTDRINQSADAAGWANTVDALHDLITASIPPGYKHAQEMWDEYINSMRLKGAP